MGITLNLAMIMKDWLHRHHVSGPVLTLGVQDLGFSREELEFATSNGRPEHSLKRLQRATRDMLQANGANESGSPSRFMKAAELFRDWKLGEIAALDVSDFEGADIIFDLNEVGPPPGTERRFGLIVNGGTLEHVFHLPNALETLNRMTKIGGCILHVMPANNWLNHGFYQFSPTLVFDYYEVLGATLLESALISFDHRQDKGRRWEVRPVTDGQSAYTRDSSLGSRTYLFCALIRLNEMPNSGVVPIQSYYRHTAQRRPPRPRWFPPYDVEEGIRTDYRSRRILPLTSLSPEQGHCWHAPLSEIAFLSDTTAHPSHSPLVLLEDERALGPAHAPHKQIREEGGGTYSHWGDQIYFSTSDGSDPRSNGRRYLAVVPHPSVSERRLSE